MATAVVLAVLLVAYNTALNLVGVPDAAYVPANAALAVVLLLLGWGGGLGRVDLGLSGLGPGLRWGGGIVAAIAIGLAIALAVPALRPLLADQRVAGITTATLAFRVLVRIPIGTALLEEVAFRGVLHGLLADARGLLWAVVGSAAAFGLWHIGPALELVRANRFGWGPGITALFVIGAVVGTAAGGVVLSWLRIRTGGIVGPLVVHASANSLATLAAFWAQR